MACTERLLFVATAPSAPFFFYLLLPHTPLVTMFLLPPLLIPFIEALVVLLFCAHDAGYGLVPITPGMVRNWKIHAIVPAPSPGSVPAADVVDSVLWPAPTSQILAPIDSHDGISNSTAGSEERALPDPPNPSNRFFKAARSIFDFLVELAWLFATVYHHWDDYVKENPGLLDLLRAHNADMEALEALTAQLEDLEKGNLDATITHQAEADSLHALLRMSTEDRLARINK